MGAASAATHALVFPGPGPNNGLTGGDMVSTWVTNLWVHAEVQITS